MYAACSVQGSGAYLSCQHGLSCRMLILLHWAPYQVAVCLFVSLTRPKLLYTHFAPLSTILSCQMLICPPWTHVLSCCDTCFASLSPILSCWDIRCRVSHRKPSWLELITLGLCEWGSQCVFNTNVLTWAHNLLNLMKGKGCIKTN